MADTTSKIHIGWDEIHELVDIICDNLALYPHIDSVHGLARGGLIPAVMISHKRGLDYVQEADITENTLIVDDICDSGHTLDNAPGWWYAVLHHKPSANFEPTIWGKIIKDQWIVYPWEREDSETIQDYLKNE